MFGKKRKLKNEIKQLKRYVSLFEKRYNVWPQARDFVMHHGGEYFPDYNTPQTMQEKIAWAAKYYYLKSPLAYFSGNKVTSKIYFESKLGTDDYIVKTYGIYNSPDEIDWGALPNSFAIKTTMGFQGKNVILVKNKKKFRPKKHQKTLWAMTRSLHDGKPCPIIIEQLLDKFPETDSLQITDYKIFCFNGEPKFIRVHSVNKKAKVFGSYDKNMTYYSLPEYEKLDLIHASIVRHHNPDVPQPDCLDEMIKVAKKLSKDLPFARVDLYVADGKIYVGELTIQGAVGYVLDPVKFDYVWGEQIKLPTHDEIEKLIEQDKIHIKKLVDKNIKTLEKLSNFAKIMESL